jgi:hypothetical protein
LSRSLVALDQNSTIIAVVEMSQSSWLVAGMLPGLSVSRARGFVTATIRSTHQELELVKCHAAATAVSHCAAASARNLRSVDLETRWR